MIAKHQVRVLFTAPTAIRAIKKEDPNGECLARYDLGSLQNLYLAGERLDPPTYQWLGQLLQRPVIDHWWQTETGWAIVANMAGLETTPTRAGSATYPVPGYAVEILRDDGSLAAVGEQGNIALRLPLPPGCMTTIWRDQARFEQAYLSQFPGYYLSGDGGLIDADGYVFVMGRTDDVINVAGHRLSTGELEEVVGSHPAVAECAVIGAKDSLKGQLPVALVCLKDGVDTDAARLQADIVKLVRERIGPLAGLREVLVARRLPKTRSGKILRGVMHKIADGEDYTAPSTIDDPACLAEIEALLAQRA